MWRSLHHSLLAFLLIILWFILIFLQLLQWFLCQIVRYLIQFFNILNFNQLLHDSFLDFGFSFKVIEYHLNTVIIIPDNFVSLLSSQIIVYLHHFLQLSQRHSRKFNSLETCQSDRKVILTSDDDIVTRILLSYEFYLL